MNMNMHKPSYPANTTQDGISATLPINKIVVVGHPLSGFESVESLLNRCGMQTASPSQREGLSPTSIGATLLKVHRIAPLDTLNAHGPIKPLQPGPIWQSLALDLLLGNINHDLWGWSDPQAVYLLDYWKNLDPQLAFMLVYDTPQELIARAFDDFNVPCTPETLQTAIDNWQAYNEALLYFYHRNPQRCLLVHAAQVSESATEYLQQVQKRLDAPLGMSKEGTSAPTTHQAPDALRRYLAQHILNAQPQALNLYEELQAVASLPQSASITTQQPNEAGLALEALQSHLTQQQHLRASDQQARVAQTRIQALEQEQAQLRKTLQSSQNEQAANLKENDLLLNQLHQVQEDLEKLYLENQKRQQQIEELSKTNLKVVTEKEQAVVAVKAASEAAAKQAKEHTVAVQELKQAKANLEQQVAQRQQQIDQQARVAQTRIQALEQEQAQLRKTLQSSQNEQAANLKENDLLLNQLHQVQEDLEKLYLENQKRQQQIEELSKTNLKVVTEKEQAVVAVKAASEAAAKQAKEHTVAVQELKQAKANLEQQVAQRQPQNKELQQENDLLLAQLHQVQEELERYYLENQRLKSKPVDPPKPAQAPAIYGAGERIKQQLSYRLGHKMIERSRSFGGWLGMPSALFAVARQYQRELPERQATKEIPIEKYRDAYEADRVKQHLSYRLGIVLIKHGKNPLRWPILPFALHKVRQEWLQQKDR